MAPRPEGPVGGGGATAASRGDAWRAGETRSVYVTIVGTGDPARIVFQGRDEDRLRPVDGKWRIVRRRILPECAPPHTHGVDRIDLVVAAGVAGAP